MHKFSAAILPGGDGLKHSGRVVKPGLVADGPLRRSHDRVWATLVLRRKAMTWNSSGGRPPGTTKRCTPSSRRREDLLRMVHLRLSRRLAGRVDDSDVLQEADVEATRKLAEYAREPKLPVLLWLRHQTALKLAEVHRHQLGTQLRDADREVTLHRGGLPMADSVSPWRPSCWAR